MATQPTTTHHGDDAGHGGHHVIPPHVYAKVFAALMVFLLLTVGAAMIDLPPALAITVAVAIAVFKAAIVVAYFMHVKFSSRLVRLFAVSAVGWLAILFVLALMDYLSRDLFHALGSVRPW